MSRPRILCGLLLLCLALLASGASLLWLVNSRQLTRAQVEGLVANRTIVGMSRDEVIRIVGGPPGEEMTARDKGCYSQFDYWLCDDLVLFVQFDDAETAIEVRMEDAGYFPPVTVFDRVRTWLGM